MTTHVWEPDFIVDAETARGLIAAQFPEIDVASVERIGQGWDNAAYLVEGRYVFRFPQREIAVPLIEVETGILPLIAPALPLAVPVPRFAGKPSAPFPRPFAGYEMLAGKTACEASLDDAQRAEFARPLGAFLRALHGIDPAPAVARGLPGDTIGRLSYERRLSLATSRFAELAALGCVTDVEPLLEYLTAHPPKPCPNPRVVHGDLYARHVLLDENHAVCGVIDWGDLHLGDPALDVAIAFMMLPAAARPPFFEAYGGADARTRENALFRAIYHSALTAHYGAHTGDAGMLDLGLTGLAFAREALAGG